MDAQARNPDLTHPVRLGRLLGVGGLVSLVLILTLSGFGVYGVYSDQVIANAREDSIHIGEVLWQQERDNFLTRDQAGGQQVAAQGDMRGVDQELRRFLRPFGIVKIKVFDAWGTIVYSTDAKIIGRIDQDNPRLARALQGEVDAKLERKGTFLDLAEEEILDIDVVETYVPIHSDANVVIGAFEVYIDVTKYRQQIRAGVQQTLLVLAGILVLVYLPSLFIVRRATGELRRAQQALSALATTDALTGLFNRSHLMRRLQEESSRLRRVREAPPWPGLALIMVDIDHFKRINDAHGHPAGDAVLREVGRRLGRAKREYDLLGRYGGEEFLCVLPGTDLANARGVAERLRRTIAAEPFALEGKELRVTISLGVAVVLAGEEDCQAALKRADDGLYAAKRAGRDGVGCVD